MQKVPEAKLSLWRKKMLNRVLVFHLFTFFFTGLAWAHDAPSTTVQKEQYINENLQLFEVEARYITNYTNDIVPAFRYAIKNSGPETLNRIKVVVYFLDEEGNAFYEEDYLPIFVSDYNVRNGGPLRPNYTFRMEQNQWMTEKSLGDEWGGEIRIEIIDIEFAE